MVVLKTCLLLLVAELVAGQDVFVRSLGGIIRGTQKPVNNVNIEQYLGLPYAAPPVGPLRFKPPEPPLPWNTGTPLDATTFKPMCPQLNRNQANLNLSTAEDCLYLNVYTSAKRGANLPVIVYIHGGGWRLGAGAIVDPSYLVSKGVVVVTINYRLTVLGFLSMNHASAPGNYGMLDQVMAMMWVRGYIADFGGNGADVTLMGFSSGSASTSLHLVSPLSRGWFDRTIQVSGSGVSFWASGPPEKEVKVAMALADKVGCGQNKENLEVTVDCLRNVDVSFLINSTASLTQPERGIAFGPVVENYYGFLPDTPQNLIERGESANVAVLLGFAREELAGVVDTIDGAETGVDARAAEEMWANMADQLYPGYGYQVTQEVKRLYLNASVSADRFKTREALIQLLGDLRFTSPAVHESKLLSNHPLTRPVYTFEMTYRAENNPAPLWHGTTHLLSMHVYIMGWPFVGTGRQSYLYPWEWTDNDRQFSTNAIDMTLNFIKYNNPTPSPVGGLTWEPFTTYTGKMYADLDLTPEMKADLRPKKMDFWIRELPDLLSPHTAYPSSAVATSILLPLLCLCLALSL